MMLDFHLFLIVFSYLFQQKLIPHGQKCLQRSKSVLAETDSEEEIRFDHGDHFFKDNR